MVCMPLLPLLEEVVEVEVIVVVELSPCRRLGLLGSQKIPVPD